MAARMWRATDGVSTSRPYTDDALRCVLCFLAIAGVDVLCGVATFPASVTGGGPLHAWVNGAVDGRYGVAAMAVGVNALLSAAAVVVVVRDFAKRGSVSGVPGGAVAPSPVALSGSTPGSLVAALAALLPSSFGGGGSGGGGGGAAGSSSTSGAVVQNGVLVPRSGRPVSSLVQPPVLPEGRRLGTV